MGTDQVTSTYRPPMSVKQFMSAFTTYLTDDAGGYVSLETPNNWWLIRVECICAGNDYPHHFRRASRSLFDLEETLYELHEIMREDLAH